MANRNIENLSASLKIGNISVGEYLDIDTKGRINQSMPMYDDLRVSPTSLPLVGSRPPSFEIVTNDGSATTGSAFDFNGSNSYGIVPYYSDMNMDSMSIAMWVHPDSVGSLELIDRNGSGGFEFYVSNGKLTFSPTGSQSTATGNGTVVTGATQLVVVTVNNEGANIRVRLYVNDNKLQESVINDTLNTGTDGYIIGEYHNGGWNYDGILDDIQVYNIVLSDSQITEMYNEGAGITGLPTGVTETTDLVARFQDSVNNTATLGSNYDMVDTNISMVDGLIGITTGSFGVAALGFYPDIISEIFFTAQLPHTYLEEGDIYPHVHWESPVVGSGDIVWGLEYKWANVGVAVPNTTIVTNPVACPSIGVHTATDITTLEGTGKKISSILMCRLFRDGTDPLDTCANKVLLSEFDFHFPVNTFGSRGIWTK